ncbi:DNA-binding FadR family transcriptional regulator [Sedimentibacter acidaminivorans]|uniref:DNA-binding FadR family transcriptional regulator n=1 Tax=Sedimentibacter acidaminivorans TaxID=913099 RepID=A0ABS4GAQ2_9FIRM|nr:GntR family transcriptional regulator [Sedimentibacter acidaminivorans]MBP1924756.1 DNA-binding FadR family transcriptional regulator [Sedimentibacter acidaminivorans]
MSMENMLVPIKKGSVSQLIIDRITDALISGELKPGSKIPTEIEFSESLGVGRNSVREATKILESFGVLEVKQSEGTFIAKEFSQKMLDPMVYGVIMQNGDMSELLEFKLSNLRAVLHMAVFKAIEKDIDDLQECYVFLCDTIKNHPDDEKAIYEANKEFHDTLAKVSDNRYMYQINTVIMKISKYSRMGGIRSAIKEGKTEEIANVCKALLDLVKTRDVENINPVLDKIYEYWKHLLL